MEAVASKRVSLVALSLTLLLYLFVLLATGMAGPMWALWLWSLLALPQYWEGARRLPREQGRGRFSWTAIALLIVWMSLVVGLPALGLAVKSPAWWPPAPLRYPLAALIVGLPLIVTLALLKWELARRRMSGRGHR